MSSFRSLARPVSGVRSLTCVILRSSYRSAVSPASGNKSARSVPLKSNRTAAVLHRRQFLLADVAAVQRLDADQRHEHVRRRDRFRDFPVPSLSGVQQRIRPELDPKAACGRLYRSAERLIRVVVFMRVGDEPFHRKL